MYLKISAVCDALKKKYISWAKYEVIFRLDVEDAWHLIQVCHSALLEVTGVRLMREWGLFGDLSSRFGGYGKVGCEDGWLYFLGVGSHLSLI